MSETFGQSARTSYGIAARLLGWRPQEFWAATPVELTCAIALPESHFTPIGRNEINRMMERDHGNPR